VARVLPLLTLALLAAIGIARLRGRLEHLPASDVALAAVLFTVVTSRVFSGQYFIWLLGLAAVSVADPHSRMRRTTGLLIAAGLATHLVYPWLYSALLEASPPAVLVQLTRVGLTVAATVTAALVLWRHGSGPAGSEPSGTEPAGSEPPGT
jgi:hypothetical protein